MKHRWAGSFLYDSLHSTKKQHTMQVCKHMQIKDTFFNHMLLTSPQSFRNKEFNYSSAVQELWYFKGEEVSHEQSLDLYLPQARKSWTLPGHPPLRHQSYLYKQRERGIANSGYSNCFKCLKFASSRRYPNERGKTHKSSSSSTSWKIISHMPFYSSLSLS